VGGARECAGAVQHRGQRRRQVGLAGRRHVQFEQRTQDDRAGQQRRFGGAAGARFDVMAQRGEVTVDLGGGLRLVQRLHDPVRGGREGRQFRQHARILGVELPLGIVGDGPDGADRLVVDRPRHEQAFEQGGTAAAQRREAARRAVEQQRRIALDDDAARAVPARHRGAGRVGVRTGDRVPAEHVAVRAVFEDADAGRAGAAQLQRQFGEPLQDTARSGHELLAEQREGAALRAVVRRTYRAACEFVRDQDLVEVHLDIARVVMRHVFSSVVVPGRLCAAEPRTGRIGPDRFAGQAKDEF
jgi:hypothetical protein